MKVFQRKSITRKQDNPCSFMLRFGKECAVMHKYDCQTGLVDDNKLGGLSSVQMLTLCPCVFGTEDTPFL